MASDRADIRLPSSERAVVVAPDRDDSAVPHHAHRARAETRARGKDVLRFDDPRVDGLRAGDRLVCLSGNAG